jgi:hypothetical protein
MRKTKKTKMSNAVPHIGGCKNGIKIFMEEMMNENELKEIESFEKDLKTFIGAYVKKIEQCKFRPKRCLHFDVKNVSQFKEDDLEKALGEIKNNAVYIITSQKPFEDSQKKAYMRCKDDGFQMSRDMTEESCGKTDKPCLYVGSSITNVNTRLKQHIGITDSKSVYALHLRQWWQDAALKIRVYQFKDDIKDYGLQFIEDYLWEKNKPLFGRKGSK